MQPRAPLGLQAGSWAQESQRGGRIDLQAAEAAGELQRASDVAEDLLKKAHERFGALAVVTEDGSRQAEAVRGSEEAQPGVPGWHLSPGDHIPRTELHQRYGGSGQGGIAPSTRSSCVLIFSDPAAGQQHGYMDFWDGQVLNYYGEGGPLCDSRNEPRLGPLPALRRPTVQA